MGAKIYVGGLPYTTDEARLGELFAPHGRIESVRIITDRLTGRSRGFGFVEMATREEAASAIAALNGVELDGRALTVNEARPLEPRAFPSRDAVRRPAPKRGRTGRTRGRW